MAQLYCAQQKQQQHSRTAHILATIERMHRRGESVVPSVHRRGATTAAVVDHRMRVMAQVYELLVRNRRATKRDLFYEHKQLFGTQANFNRALTALCKCLNACRNELNVISCSRGFAIGNLRLFDGMDDDALVDFRSSPVALVDSLCRFNLVHSDAQFLLVVEKDAIFQRLVDEQFTHKFPRSILLTGRGYPDFCTRQFLHWLSIQLPSLPMFVLVDADPYGVEIFLVYKYGSARSAVEAGPLHLPRLKWLGFLPSEAQTLPIPHNQFLQLTQTDRKRIERIAQRVNSQPDGDSAERTLFNYELSVMLNSSHKLELEALCAVSANFLSTVYLDNKLLPLNVSVVSLFPPLPPQNDAFNSSALAPQQQHNFSGNATDFDSDQQNGDAWSDQQSDDCFDSDREEMINHLGGGDQQKNADICAPHPSDFESDHQNDDDFSDHGGDDDDFGSVHGEDDFGGVHGEDDFGDVHAEDDFGDVHAEDDFGDVHAEDDFGSVHGDADFGSVHGEDDFESVYGEDDFGSVHGDADFGTVRNNDFDSDG